MEYAGFRRPLFWALITPFVAMAAHGLDDQAGNEFQSLFGDEEFVSIATGQAQPLSNAPAVATVITEKQIEAMGAINLDQVLETVPGLHVSLSSSRFSPIYSMRGIHTNFNPQVLMLVNGVPLTQALSGDRGPRSTLPVNNIARVEVIRGPGSAVYGADAFAGVINVITKSSEEIGGTELGAVAGSFGSAEVWLNHGSSHGELDLAVSVNWGKTNGDSNRVIDSDAQSVFDRISVAYNSLPPVNSVPAALLPTNASQAPGAADTQDERVDLRIELAYKRWKMSLWNWRQTNSGVGPGLTQALDPQGRGDTDDYLFDVAYNNADSFESWDLGGRFSYMDINHTSEQTLFPAGTILPLGADGNVNLPGAQGFALFTQGMIGNPETYEQTSRLDGSASYSGFSNHRLRLAGGLSYSKLQGKETKNFGPGVATQPTPAFQVIGPRLTSVTDTPFVYIPDVSRRNYYASIQDEWRFAKDWNLTVGLRYDDYSDFGSTLNPRVALVWDARQELTAKFLYGRAFRAPSFGELFLINNPVAMGNEDLDPETINTYELALDYRPSYNVHTGVSFFYYEIEDLIKFEVVTNPLDADFRAQRAANTGSQIGHGLELEAQWQAHEQVMLSGSYALQKSKDTATGQTVPNAPRHQVYGEVSWSFASNWEWNTQVNWVAGRERAADDPRKQINDYTIMNMAFHRRNIANRLDLSLIAQNLLDSDAYEPSPGDANVPGGSLVPGDYPLPGRAMYIKAAYSF